MGDCERTRKPNGERQIRLLRCTELCPLHICAKVHGWMTRAELRAVIDADGRQHYRGCAMLGFDKLGCSGCDQVRAELPRARLLRTTTPRPGESG